MTKAILIGVAACLFLSGCSITRIQEERCEGPTGELEFKALRRERPETLTDGYSIALVRDGKLVASRECDPNAPVLLKDLAPGPYEVTLRGERLNRQDFGIEIKAGRRTSIAVLHRNVRRAERTEKAAAAVGKAILYTVGFVIYIIVMGLLEDDDDGECDRCHHSPCCCSGAPPARVDQPRKFSSYKKP